MTRGRALIRMAWRDLAHEWTVSLAVCLAIAAVAAPILVLLGLHAGVIGEIFAGLRADPAAREIRLQATGSARFDPAWFDRVRTMPEVAFVVPATRFASTQVQVFDGSGAHERRASLLPTGPGDPLFGPGQTLPVDPGQAAISARLASELNVSPGESVTIEATRRVDGRTEQGFTELTVIAVTEAATFDREALFVTLPLLIEIEDFKDGAAAPILGADGPQAAPRSAYPDFRLYARDVTDVAPLAERLRAPPDGLSIRAETGRIAFATGLDRNLKRVIGAVAALGCVGLAGGLATIQWSMAARRRRTIAVMSLLGFGRPALVGLPLVQAVMLAAAGIVLTVLAGLGLAALINLWLGEALGGTAARIGIGPVAGLSALILGISMVPALWIGIKQANMEPADEIRET